MHNISCKISEFLVHLWRMLVLNIGCTFEAYYSRVAGFLRIHVILPYFKQKEMQHITWSQWTNWWLCLKIKFKKNTYSYPKHLVIKAENLKRVSIVEKCKFSAETHWTPQLLLWSEGIISGNRNVAYKHTVSHSIGVFNPRTCLYNLLWLQITRNASVVSCSTSRMVTINEHHDKRFCYLLCRSWKRSKVKNEINSTWAIIHQFIKFKDVLCYNPKYNCCCIQYLNLVGGKRS